MASKLMIRLVAAYALNLLVYIGVSGTDMADNQDYANLHSRSGAVNVMTVSMPSSNNWEIGMTMDSNFARRPSPFTTETVQAFQSAWETKKEEGNWDQSGTFEMTTRLVQSQEDKLEAIDVAGSLELSYMMFSGDAHMEFAKNNIDSALDVSLIVKANSYGRKGQMDMSETGKLQLKETTAADLEEFEELYGSYLIVGFEYGGEIMFQSTHSVRSKEDKLKVAGGLSMSYGSAGFSVAGSVDGGFSTEDVKNSFSSETAQLIRPNIISDEVSQILIDLQKLAAGDPSTENFESLSSNAQLLLGGDKLDPIKAVVVELATVDAVFSMFVDSPEYEDTVAFMQFLNGMFVGVEALKKQLLIVEGGWDQYAPDEKPWLAIGNWDNKLTQLSEQMKSLNQRKEIIDKAGVYNLISPHKDWMADVMEARSFVNLTKRGMTIQFESAIMDPYEIMLAAREPTPAPVECIPSATTSGFSETRYNGHWAVFGTCNGEVSYKHDQEDLYLFRNAWDSATWIDNVYCGNSVYYYYDWGSTNSWKSRDGESVPGSVQYVICPEGQGLMAWSDWYQLHYRDLVALSCVSLSVLCCIMLCTSVLRKQRSHYVPTKRVHQWKNEYDTDLEAKPINK